MNLVECTICLETIDLNYKNFYITNCRHCFHNKCLSKWYNILHSKSDLSNNFFCPNCRQPISDYILNDNHDNHYNNFITNILFHYNSYISDLSSNNILVYSSNINYSNNYDNSNVDNSFNIHDNSDIVIYDSNDYETQYDNTHFFSFLNNLYTSFTCSYSRSNYN
jgi:hypothetical protein